MASAPPAATFDLQTGIAGRVMNGQMANVTRRPAAQVLNPMHLDDVAADFPDMTEIIAHPSFPWQHEALSVCLHKPNVYIDLSGWSPKYLPPQLVQHANGQLKHKMLFGSDFPLITPDRWI
ncbi:MAG TPA: amidohydrolase family protein [Steroidobacteraceae bacterium]